MPDASLADLMIPFGKSVVYFLQPEGGGPVKIGTTKSLYARHGALQCEYRKELLILKVILGDRRVEKFIHRRYRHLRFPRTEWFKPSLDLMAFIGHPDRASNAVVEPPRIHPPKYKEFCEDGLYNRERAEYARFLEREAKSARLAPVPA